MPGFKAEYAKSGRATCKGCSNKIEKSELRLGKMVTLENVETYIKEVPNWYMHLL